MAIILLFVILVCVFFIIKDFVCNDKIKTTSKPISSWFSHYPPLITILILGIALRLLLATTESSNFDMHMFMYNAELFVKGKQNIYLNNWSYNYSPAFFYISGILEIINKKFTFITYPIIQRMYISFFDVLTLFILIAIAKKQQISATRTAVFFFLNPITILLSGYHGQFDNNAVFFLLLAVWFYYYSGVKFTKWKKPIAWFLLTIGFIIKHIIPFQVFLVQLSLFKKNAILKGSILFTLTVLAFLASFAPYYKDTVSRFVINDYVLGYQGPATISGATGVIRFFCVTCEIFGMRLFTIYRYIFLAGGMLFPLLLIRSKNLLHSLLLTFLFFLAFTSAHTAQYLVLPMALGALFPSRWFLTYTATVTIYLLAFQMEVDVPAYIKVVLINVVWIVSFFWFISELIQNYKPANNTFRKILFLFISSK